MAIPGTGGLFGRRRSIKARVEPQTDPIDDEPFEAIVSDTKRMV